jgi:mono/diheme cytochrome c family protein
MAEESNSSESHGGHSEPEYGPTYYAPVEMPMPRLPRPPFWMISLALISTVATWLPLAIIARARQSTMTEPRIQLMQDMGIQPKFREQEINPLFADERAMRLPPPGTVAFGPDVLQTDDNYYRGFARRDDGNGQYTVVFADALPKEIFVNARGKTPEAKMHSILERGQQRFNIYCYVCHGYDGSGQGPVNQRAMQLKALDTDPQNPIGVSWTPAAQLYAAQYHPSQYPDGKIFNTITNGIRTMPAYGSQIPVDDRWAIVAYVRALQLSQGGAPPDVTQGK